MSSIRRIKIMLTTNISGSRPFPLTYDTFYKGIEPKSNEPKSNEPKSDEPKSNDVKSKSRGEAFPYFTYDTEISPEKIKELPKDQRILCFFNKTLFSKILNTSSMAVTPDEKHDMGNKNMKILLNTLFSTSFPTTGNISNTYNTLIRGNAIDDTSTKSIFSFGTTPMNFSYVTIGGSIYTVIRVTWLNDILNDPEFSLLFSRMAILEDWLKKEIIKLKDKIKNERSKFDTIQKEFIKSVKENPTFEADIKKDLDQISRWFTSYRSPIAVSSQQIRDAVNTLVSNIKESNPTLFASIVKIHDLNLLKPSTVYTEIIPLTLLKMRTFKDLFRIVEYSHMDEDTIEYFEEPVKYLELIDLKKRRKMSKQQDLIFSHLNKYNEFTSIFQLIEPFTSKRTIVTNPILQNIFNSFTEKDPELLKLSSYVESLQKFSPDTSKTKYSNMPALEIGIITNGSNKKEEIKNSQNIFEIKSKEEYHVYVALDLVKGMLTSETINQIRCLYKDFRASSLYKDLRENSKKNKLRLYRPQEMASVNSFVNKTKSKSKSKSNLKLKKGGFQVKSPKKPIEKKMKPRNKTRRRKTSEPKESPNNIIF